MSRYNYHMRLHGFTEGETPWNHQSRMMLSHETIPDMIAEAMLEIRKHAVVRLDRVTIMEGHRILLDWGPMHMAVYDAFAGLMKLGGGS